MSSSESCRYVRSSTVFFSKLPDGQCAILDTERSLYFGLNTVGARMWGLLERPQSMDSLVKQLRAEFDVSEEQCQREVRRFIEQMTAKALVLELR